MKSNHTKELNTAYQKKVIGLLDAVVRRTALAVDRELVLETPVGNPSLWRNPDAAPDGYVGGRARSNWLASVGSARTEAGDQVTRSAGDSVQATLAAFNLNDTIFITNNLPYIKRLNEGHSTQAPAGFIDAIIARNKRKASEVRGLIINA